MRKARYVWPPATRAAWPSNAKMPAPTIDPMPRAATDQTFNVLPSLRVVVMSHQRRGTGSARAPSRRRGTRPAPSRRRQRRLDGVKTRRSHTAPRIAANPLSSLTPRDGIEVQSQRSCHICDRQLPAHTVAGRIQGRRKCCYGELTRRHRQNPAAYTAFARETNSVRPIARRRVQLLHSHFGEHVRHILGDDDPLLGRRVDAAGSERGAHRSEVDGGNERRALASVDVNGPHRVAITSAGAVEQPSNRAVVKIRRLL